MSATLYLHILYIPSGWHCVMNAHGAVTKRADQCWMHQYYSFIMLCSTTSEREHTHPCPVPLWVCCWPWYAGTQLNSSTRAVNLQEEHTHHMEMSCATTVSVFWTQKSVLTLALSIDNFCESGVTGSNVGRMHSVNSFHSAPTHILEYTFQTNWRFSDVYDTIWSTTDTAASTDADVEQCTSATWVHHQLKVTATTTQ